MTSRRSRLKAVANLPVRRKPPAVQGSTNDAISPENLTPEKVFSSPTKADEINGTTNTTCQKLDNKAEKNINPTEAQNDKSQQTLVTNSNSDFHITENSTLGKVINETNKFSNLDKLENNNDLNRNCNLISSNNLSPAKDTKCFKPNIVSILTQEGGPPPQNSVVYEENQNINKVNVDEIITNNVINNKDSNIIENGMKCYTVLTSQNITGEPVSNYTITTLTPCVDTGDNDIYAHAINQEFEEVQIYTEVVEPTEICIANEINDNNGSLIESDSSLINCTIQNQIEDISVNIDYNQSNLSDSTNLSQSIPVKPVKNGIVNAKLNNSNSEDYYENPVMTVKDRPVLGNSVSPLSQNVPNELNSSLKQSITSVRRKRSKCNDFTKKLADAKREFQKKYEKTKPDRSTLKMIDLIFYNPTTNPMESKAKFDKKESSITQTELIQEMLSEEKVDEPEPLDNESGLLSNDNTESESLSKMPVPQVKIGLNGEIILDEKSLIIETTEAKKGREDLQNSVPIFEDRGSKVSYYRGKTRKTRDWADYETKRFYKALNTIGPDFTLMQTYFPKRSRLELKNKFKREERLNRNLIDRALNNPSEFDMTQLEQDLAVEKKAEEEEVEMRLCRGVKQATKRPRIRSSFLSREMIESDGESENTHSKGENALAKKMSENERIKKRKENNLLFEKFLMKESEAEISDNSSSSLGVFSRVEHGVT